MELAVALTVGVLVALGGSAAAAELFGLLHAAGVTCVSVGQDCESMEALHAAHLRLGVGGGGRGQGGAGWTLHEVRES